MNNNKIADLEETVSKAQEAYYNGNSIMDDDEYDALVYQLEQLDPNNQLLKKVGAEPVSSWEKVKHRVTLGSLFKVNYPDELSKWISNDLSNKETLVVEKLDGLSVGLQYENGKLIAAPLRGEGTVGENILVNVLKMHGCVKNVPGFNGTIRGEIILKKSDHQKHFSNYSNPRNAASGICRRFDSVGCEHLTLMCYNVIGDAELETEESSLQWLEKHKFIVPSYKLCKKSSDVVSYWNEYQNGKRDSLDYLIDGLVVNCNDIAYGKSLGETNLKPKSKMAFKFANQFVKTTVTNITWNTGASGRVTPICWFNKVNILGTDVEKASVYNVAYVKELGLDVGADILVCKANEVIPRVEKVVKGTGTVVKSPINCSDCNNKLITEGEYLLCNNSNCPSQTLGKIVNWIGGINVLEWGEQLLTKLIAGGKVNTIADLYKLSINDLKSIDRMGDKSAKNCYESLWSVTELPIEILLGSLSIPMVGSSVVKMVTGAGYDTLEKIRKLSVIQLQEVNGLGPAKAESFYNGLIANKGLIDELLSLGIKIKEKTVGKLSGKSICITGSLSMKRAEFEKLIESNGGVVKSSVTKTTSYLVTNAASDSSKAVNAKKLGVKVLNEKEILDMLDRA